MASLRMQAKTLATAVPPGSWNSAIASSIQAANRAVTSAEWKAIVEMVASRVAREEQRELIKARTRSRCNRTTDR
jgi:hypothetical protein